MSRYRFACSLQTSILSSFTFRLVMLLTRPTIFMIALSDSRYFCEKIPNEKTTFAKMLHRVFTRKHNTGTHRQINVSVSKRIKSEIRYTTNTTLSSFTQGRLIVLGWILNVNGIATEKQQQQKTAQLKCRYFLCGLELNEHYEWTLPKGRTEMGRSITVQLVAGHLRPV